MKILFLSRWYPYPPNNGSKLRVYNLLRGLAKEHEITLLSFVDEPSNAKQNGDLLTICNPIYTIPWKAYNPKSITARLGFLSILPRSVKDTFSQEMAGKIDELLSKEKFDCIIASQADMAGYWRYFHELPAIFEEVELGVFFEGYALAQGSRSRVRNGLTWFKHSRYISSLVRNIGACTVVSEKEKQILGHVIPDDVAVWVIPNCINLEDYDRVPRHPDPRTLIFTGSFRYFPNYNAMTWFVQEILPLIKTEEPEARLVITGDHANLPLPPMQDVFLTGFVEDVRPLVASASVSIAPLLQGGGTRLKILEAMALGTPVVATRKGADGLDVVHGENILLADTPEEYARAVIKVLSDPELRHRLSENGSKLVKNRYDWSVVLPKFMGLVQQVAAQRVIH